MPDNKTIPIRFCFQKKTSLSERNRLRAFIFKMAAKNGFSIKDIQVVFCSDDYLLKINKLYLNHNFYTDIITFDYSDKKNISGELYISVDRVKDNAAEFGVSFRSELHRVLFHGVLHLLGYNDKTPRQKTSIRLLEDKWLFAYGIR